MEGSLFKTSYSPVMTMLDFCYLQLMCVSVCANVLFTDKGSALTHVFMSVVAQSNGLKPGPPSDPQTPPPPYETSTWSQQPYHPSFTCSALQQLWLNCPDTFSQLLTPGASLRLSTQPKSRSCANAHHASQKPLSVETAKLAGALQQHIQMLACGNSSASVAMLHDLTAFLEAYSLQRSAVRESSRLPAAAGEAAAHRPLSQGLRHQAATAESAEAQAAAWIEASEAASEAAASAALQVVSVLVAHDKACQQAVVRSPDPTKANTQVHY